MIDQSILIHPAPGNDVACPNSTSQPFPQIHSYWKKTAKQLIAGGLSGCIEVCFTYPTDFVKIMLQLTEKGNSPDKVKFKNSLDVVRQTVHEHGPLGVYRGFSVVFFGSFPKYMLRFGSYEQIKPFFVDQNGQLSSRDKMLCGLGAGICEALFAVIPQESIKVKFINDRISDKPKYKGLINGIAQIIKENGLRGTYQGVTPTLIKQGSNQAIRFSVFESLRDWYIKDDPSKPLSKAVTPLFGAIAGATSVMCNTPMDVVKTQMQGLHASRYKSTVDCIMQIYRNEGLLAFYKGLTPRLAKVTLEVAIAFSAYGAFIELFK